MDLTNCQRLLYWVWIDSIPYQSSLPNEIPFSEEEKLLVTDAVEELLLKGAIQLSDWEPKQHVSNIFIVPKPNGKVRPIINLKHLNKFVHYEHFKQEHFKVVLDLIHPNYFFTFLLLLT